MKKLIAILAFLPFFVMADPTIAPGTEMTTTVKCYPADEFFVRIENKFGETINLSYINEGNMQSSSIAILMNKTKGTWTLIEYNKDVACVMAYGHVTAL